MRRGARRRIDDKCSGIGLGLAAAYIQAASPAALSGPQGAEALLIMGQLGERLADRASSPGASTGNNKAADTRLAGHLDVAARHGLRFTQRQVIGNRRTGVHRASLGTNKELRKGPAQTAARLT